MKLKGICIIILMIWGFSACSRSAQPDYWPTDGWRTSTPEEQGVSSVELAEALEAFISDPNTNIHSFLMIRNGYIIAEYYAPGYDENTLHNLHSATKSFTGTLIGIAERKGILDVDDPVLKYFPFVRLKNENELKEQITIENLLTMSSGLGGDPLTTKWDGDMGPLQEADNWKNFLLEMEPFGPSGVVFDYNSCDSHYLMVILDQIVQKPTSFINKNLFRPLGIRNYIWAEDPQGRPIGGWGLHLTTRDMAKLAFLYQNNGVWNHRRLLNSEWIVKARTDAYPDNSEVNYSYQFWISKNGERYIASGFGGQNIISIPEDNVVIVTTSEMPFFERGFRGEWEDPATPAYLAFWDAYINFVRLEDSLPVNQEGFSQLEETIQRYSEDEWMQQEVPAIIQEWVGKDIVFDSEDYMTIVSTGMSWVLNDAIEKIRIDEIQDDQLVFTISYLYPEREEPLEVQYVAGLDNRYRINDCRELYLPFLYYYDDYYIFHYSDPEDYQYAIKASFNSYPYFLKNNSDQVSLDLKCHLIGSAYTANVYFLFFSDRIALQLDTAETSFTFESDL